MSLHDGVCSPFNPVGSAICHYYNRTIRRRSASKVKSVLNIYCVDPSQVLVHYSSSNNAECIIYIITVRLAGAVCWEAVLLHILHTPTCTNMLSLQQVKGKRMRETERNWPSPGMIRSVTRVSSLFDQVDDIRVGLIGDGAAVLQPGSGLRLLVSHSGQLGFPRWCDLFYEALPHMRFQLLANSDWACMSFMKMIILVFFLVGMRERVTEREKKERENV